MRLNYPDYIMLVKQAFKHKRANNELSRLLAKSTPANIRQACFHLYKEQYEKEKHQILRKDEHVLRDFFGPAEPGRKFLELIRDFEADRFRPLDNYLKENTENTDSKNLELLAWLIDFKYRPYSFEKDFHLTDEELKLVANDGDREDELITNQNGLTKNQEAPEDFLGKETVEAPLPIGENLAAVSTGESTSGKKKDKSKRTTIIFLILVISMGGGYAVWQQIQRVNSICVYWSNDHYEQVDCNEDPKGRIVITMDKEKVKSFRRITREDTITEWSIGKIYYIKDGNKPKYYTEAGNYPEDLNRRLKVLSQRIYENYVLKKDTSDTDSLMIKNEVLK